MIAILGSSSCCGVPHVAPVSGTSSRGGRLFSTLAATFCCQAVKEQHHNSAADSQGHAPQVKSRQISEPEESAEKATLDRPQDPQQEGGKNPPGCFPRHQELRQKASDEAEHDLRDDPHRSPLSTALNNWMLTGLPTPTDKSQASRGVG